MKKNYTRKRAISVEMFIKEFGENFSEHLKKKLMELETRCFLTRKEIAYRFDLKHVEHIQFETTSSKENNNESFSKEYCYGQFVALDGKLYFSESCIENKDIMQSPNLHIIFNSLDGEGSVIDEGVKLRKIDDSNCDFVMDSISSLCPPVSQAYLAIVRGIETRANNK